MKAAAIGWAGLATTLLALVSVAIGIGLLTTPAVGFIGGGILLFIVGAMVYADAVGQHPKQ